VGAALNAQRDTAGLCAGLNAQRETAGLAPVPDIRGHIFTQAPWLAADPTLAPWPAPYRAERVPVRRPDAAGSRPLSARI